MVLLIFIVLYVVWVIGPEWNVMKLIPRWLQKGRAKGKMNRNYY